MKKISQATQVSASSMAPVTVATGEKGCGRERAAGNAATQYAKVPRKMPSVHWVTRSLTKLSRIRGENCIDASVRVISRIAKTIDTTVMIEAAIVASTICATWGSAWDGNSTRGTQALTAGTVSSSDD